MRSFSSYRSCTPIQCNTFFERGSIEAKIESLINYRGGSEPGDPLSPQVVQPLGRSVDAELILERSSLSWRILHRFSSSVGNLESRCGNGKAHKVAFQGGLKDSRETWKSDVFDIGSRDAQALNHRLFSSRLLDPHHESKTATFYNPENQMSSPSWPVLLLLPCLGLVALSRTTQLPTPLTQARTHREDSSSLARPGLPLKMNVTSRAIAAEWLLRVA